MSRWQETIKKNRRLQLVLLMSLMIPIGYFAMTQLVIVTIGPDYNIKITSPVSGGYYLEGSRLLCSYTYENYEGTPSVTINSVGLGPQESNFILISSGYMAPGLKLGENSLQVWIPGTDPDAPALPSSVKFYIIKPEESAVIHIVSPSNGTVYDTKNPPDSIHIEWTVEKRVECYYGLSIVFEVSETMPGYALRTRYMIQSDMTGFDWTVPNAVNDGWEGEIIIELYLSYITTIGGESIPDVVTTITIIFEEKIEKKGIPGFDLLIVILGIAVLALVRRLNDGVD